MNKNKHYLDMNGIRWNLVRIAWLTVKYIYGRPDVERERGLEIRFHLARDTRELVSPHASASEFRSRLGRD